MTDANPFDAPKSEVGASKGKLARMLFYGALFGSGFAVAFVAIVTMYFLYVFDYVVSEGVSGSSREAETDTVPVFEKTSERFLGSTGSHSGDFESHNAKTLVSRISRVDPSSERPRTPSAS